MTLARLAFWFGFLELGFILRGTGLLSPLGFIAWSGGACLLLMVPQVRLLLSSVGWASQRPKTAGEKGDTL